MRYGNTQEMTLDGWHRTMKSSLGRIDEMRQELAQILADDLRFAYADHRLWRSEVQRSLERLRVEIDHVREIAHLELRKEREP